METYITAYFILANCLVFSYTSDINLEYRKFGPQSFQRHQFENCELSGLDAEVIRDVLSNAHEAAGQLPLRTLITDNCQILRNSSKIQKNIFENVSSNSCAPLVHLIKLLVEEIPRKIQQLPDLIIIDIHEFAVTTAKLSGALQLLGQLITNILQQNKGFLFDQIEFHFSCFKSSVDARLREIEDLKELYDEERKLRVIALIQPEDLGTAEVLYNDINNNSIIPEIMEGLYGAQYSEGMTAFTLIQNGIELRLVAYHKWISLLEQNNDLLSGGIVILDQLLANEVASSHPPPFGTEIAELKARVEIYVETRITLWGEEIRLGYHEEVAHFGSPKELHMIGYVFRDLMPRIIETAYNGQASNFLKVISFIEALRWSIHKHRAFQTLFNAIDEQETDQHLIVGYKIKEAMENLECGPDPMDEALAAFLSLKQALPANVRGLVWHSSCQIRSAANSQYLTATDSIPDGRNRNLTTGPQSPATRFVMPELIIGDKVTFNLVNKLYFEQYFDEHIDHKNNTINRRYVSLRETETEFNWKIEVALGANVKFYHTELKFYLILDIAPPNVDVYIFMNDFDPLQNSLWTIECSE